MVVIVGTADRLVLEKGILSNTGILDGKNEGLIVGVKVVFSGPAPPAFLLFIITATLTEVVAANAAMATAAMITWVVSDKPPVVVAAVAIVPAPAAVDVPADAAAWIAIDWRVELKL
jgi:hypothetical protein